MDYENNVGKYIGRLHYLISKRLNAFHQDQATGITADQFRLLTHLWKQDGVTQQQLAILTERDRASITRMVDILEELAIITRIPDKDDRRVNLIYLTKKGKGLEANAGKCAGSILSIVLKDFSSEDQAQFHSFLLKAIKNLEE